MPTILLFILVFAILVILHEGGHFIAARLQHVDVDEFGLGLPPRFLTMWRNKGSITINDTRIRIPRNFELPFDWYGGIHKEVVATYDMTEDGPVLRTVSLAEGTAPTNVMDEPRPSGQTHEPGAFDPFADSVRVGRGRSKAAQVPGSFELRGVVNDLRPG